MRHALLLALLAWPFALAPRAQAPAGTPRIPADIAVQLRAGEGRSALHELERMHRDRPGDPTTTSALLRLYNAVGDDAAVRLLAARTLAGAPEHSVARAFVEGRNPFLPEWTTAEDWIVRGMEHFEHERWLEAAELFDEMLVRDLRSVVAWNNLGWARAKLGFFETAVPCFRRALALAPGAERLGSNLAWAVENAAAVRRPPDPLRLP